MRNFRGMSLKILLSLIPSVTRNSKIIIEYRVFQG